MTGFLTEVAIQLKGTLSFVLGLGAMFTVAKTLLINVLVLPGVGKPDTAVGIEVRRLRTRLLCLAILGVLLFVAALGLYFYGALADLSPDALQKPGAALTPPQRRDVSLLILIAAAFVFLEALASAWKYRLTVVAAQA